MTTQNTHSEHSDVEVSVAKSAHASEPDTSSPSPEFAVPVQEPAAPPQPTETPLEGDHPEAQASEADHGEVRPFTDFIEEFRQAEARFSSSLQAYANETLSEQAPVAAATPVAPDSAEGTYSATDEESTSDYGEEQFIAPAASAGAEAQPAQEEQESPPTVETPEPRDPELKGETATPPTRPISPLLRPASRLRLPRHSVGRQREEGPINKVSAPETPTATPAEEPKVEAPLSEPAPTEEQPRPARRYRFDRPAASTTNGSATAPSSHAQARSQEVKDGAGRGTTAIPARTDTSSFTNGQVGEKEVQTSAPAKTAVSTPQSDEQSTDIQPVVQDIPGGESSAASAPISTSPTQEQERRKRHGQERQRGKEQPSTATPVAPVAAVSPVLPSAPTEPAPIAVEPTPVQAEEVNPEDLPPLEYSELQKANSRRRRRRHAGGAATVPAAPSTPVTAKATPTPTEVPPLSPVTAPTPTPAVAMPPTSTPALTSGGQHTITSGYTVSQMNKGNDGISPFMGPEPSPARGSMAAQNVRSIRTDVQRTPAYPVRTTEATSASVHQLASVVAQAIQTQTDRMVSELRRANQSPTNVSVSLPPFPSTERVGVFVDVANLLYSARTLRMTVDFGKLLDFLRGNRRLVRAHAYCPTSPQPGDEQMFLQAVKGLGYRITTKNYKTFSSGAKKADLDLDLCMDVVRLVDGRAVDCIVLVSGDSDFMPMLDYCSDHGVRVEVAAFDEAMSATLRQSCDLFINLGMLEEIRA